MTADIRDVFADTVFWIALVVKQDQYHRSAETWSLRVQGRITTTVPVLLETANALARLPTRGPCVGRLESLQHRNNVEVMPLSPQLWQRSWDLYRNRLDKTWSLTDCASFLAVRRKMLCHIGQQAFVFHREPPQRIGADPGFVRRGHASPSPLDGGLDPLATRRRDPFRSKTVIGTQRFYCRAPPPEAGGILRV